MKAKYEYSSKARLAQEEKKHLKRVRRKAKRAEARLKERPKPKRDPRALYAPIPYAEYEAGVPKFKRAEPFKAIPPGKTIGEA